MFCFGKTYSKPLSQEPQKWTQGLKHADLELTSKAHARARMAKRYTDCTGELKTWEPATGITYLQNALLACEQLKPYLRPRDRFVHDWMHALASNGCMSIACLLLLEFLDCWQSLHGYIKAMKVSNLFEAKRVEKQKRSGKLDSTASLPHLSTLLEYSVHAQSNVMAFLL